MGDKISKPYSFTVIKFFVTKRLVLTPDDGPHKNGIFGTSKS